MRAPHQQTPLDYARPDAERLPNSRIILQREQDRIRFIDPPLGSALPVRRILIYAAMNSGFSLAVLAACVIAWRLSYTASILFTLGVAMLQAWTSARWWFQARKKPTIIDIFADQIIVLNPSGKRIVIPRDKLSDIHAAKPRILPGARGRMSSLRITWGSRRIRLLQLRDYIEMRWLARQLRAAVGMDVSHFAEPPLQVIDEQEVWVTEKIHSSDAPAPQPSVLPKQTRLQRWRSEMGREYNQLGCLPFLLLAGLFFGGFFFLVRWTNVFVICLEFGFRALHDPGYRPMPHRGFLTLINGQHLAKGSDWLMFIMLLPLMFIWTLISVLIAIGINQLIRPGHERRLKRKMDRIYAEHMRIKAQRDAEAELRLKEYRKNRRGPW